jgi:trehalose 6-phosphate synthase
VEFHTKIRRADLLGDLFSLKTLRLQLRFLVPLVLTLTAAAYIALPLMDKLTLRWFARDLNMRGALVANALTESIEDALQQGRDSRVQALFNRAVQDERLVAIGLCAEDDSLLQHTAGYPRSLDCKEARQIAGTRDPLLRASGGAMQVGLYPVDSQGKHIGDLILLHDLSFIDRRSQDTRQYLIILIVVIGAAMALITMIVAQVSWHGWVKGVRAILRGEGLLRPMARQGPPELAPLAADLRARLRDLEDQYRRALGSEEEWNPDRLRSLLQSQLRGDQVIVVSNREPYIHRNTPNGVTVEQPASGLVTAVEPVMRACSGTWIAHGSGDADRSVVDSHDRVSVPPGHAEYLLRRIWITPEEEKGYYYGFANEGLWPLCHVAHVRPVFRESDWQRYREINQRFADAVVAEARGEDPIVLVQDYHFALLPAMVRAQLPRATIITFWHIPWPNPESFSICPWRQELLQGMLGSNILGFHTRFHCKNFIETVDRNLEARIEHEHSTISYQADETLIESYPISIAWPTPEEVRDWPSVAECRERVFARLGLPPKMKLALGVDRFDYTKGILERLHAVEHLLTRHPECVGSFCFVQVAAPTRSSLEEYRVFQDRIHQVTQRINNQFGSPGYQPVHLLARHHDHDALNEFYRAADVCVVTSLHDGMNLVCKEFVAARDDEQGVLVLSRFAGAARELDEALIVNPYHVEETADALYRGITMPPAEQRERMANLRVTVREFNVFRWAGRMLAHAARLRLRRRVEARVQLHQAD